MSLDVLSDAGLISDSGKLSYVAGILFGDFCQEAVIHLMSWSSHKYKRPVRSIGAAEILAAGEAIDEGKVIKSVIAKVHNFNPDLIVVVDSKDLFTSFSTKRNSIDKSIWPDVNVIRFEFETRNVDKLIWILGLLNLADPGTMRESSLSDALQLMLYSGKVPFDFTESEKCSANRSFG